MAELTTRERAASILSGAKLRMLEAEHMTVVSATEWYQTQCELVVMRKALESVEFVYDGPNDDYYCDNCGGIKQTGHEGGCPVGQALASNAGKALADRMQHLEAIAHKVKIITDCMLRETGEVVDGFRSRELMLEIHAELEAMNSVSNQPGSP